MKTTWIVLLVVVSVGVCCAADTNNINTSGCSSFSSPGSAPSACMHHQHFRTWGGNRPTPAVSANTKAEEARQTVSYSTNRAAVAVGDPAGSGYRVYVTRTTSMTSNNVAASVSTVVTNWHVAEVQKQYGPTAVGVTKFSDPTDNRWYEAPPKDAYMTGTYAEYMTRQYYPYAGYGYGGRHSYSYGAPYRYGGYTYNPYGYRGHGYPRHYVGRSYYSYGAATAGFSVHFGGSHRHGHR